MDLLNFLMGPGKSTDLCCLCLRNDKSNFDINTVFEICNRDDVILISLADMLKSLFPNGDFVFMQACGNCTDLISKLYMLIHNRKSKLLMLDRMINQLIENINDILDIPITNDKLILNVQVPSLKKLKDKDYIISGDTKNHFISELNLCNERTNLEIHNEIKVCQYCSKTFLELDALTSHLNIHRKNQVRKHIYHYCNDCNYKTLSKSSLQAHINKHHLNTRPYICHICYKGFYKRSNLNEHVQTHNNQRNQVCELCGSSFIHKKSLIEHLRLHSDTRPYNCHICQKRFVTSGRRSDHIKRSHMEKSECCLVCDKKYSLKKELKRHMNNVHLRAT